MQEIHKELVGAQKLSAGAPSGSAPIRAQISAGKPRSVTYGIDVIGSNPTGGACTYAEIESILRDHHRTNGELHHGPYEYYRLVYRYGYDLGTDPRYRDADWATVAQAARPRWEERNPSTWEQFNQMIRYAWDTARCWHGSGKIPQ